jgi:hypothetical protein
MYTNTWLYVWEFLHSRFTIISQIDALKRSHHFCMEVPMKHQMMLHAAVLILVALLPHSDALAQWSTDPNVNNPVCTTPRIDKTDLKMVSDGAGGAFLTWTAPTEYVQLNFQGDVYAQRIDSTGRLPWGENEAVLANTRLSENSPIAISDDSGGAIVTWSTTDVDLFIGSTPPQDRVFGQRLGANGTQRWALGGEYIASTSFQFLLFRHLAVAANDGGGGIIIAICFDGGTSQHIALGHISASSYAQLIGGFATAHVQQNGLAINSDGVGGAIVVWADVSAIYAQRIDTSGTMHWSTNGVAIMSGGSAVSNLPPVIVSDGAGGAIIAWRDWRNSDAIYAQRVDSAGVVQWTTNGVPVTTAANLPWFEAPALVSDNAGGAIIAWRDSSSGVGLRIQRLSNAGVVLWDSGGVAIAPTPNLALNNTPTMLADGAGGAIITWSDMRNGASNTDIYAQRIDASGVVQWTANGVAVSTATGSQTAPQIVTNGTGGAIIAWRDTRNPVPSIYGQRVNANGQLGGTTDAPDNDHGTPDAFKLNQSYPNPFNPASTFTFSIPQTANVRLSIYNVLGQEVATVVNETLNAGSYSRTFNAAGLASGAYFYRLTAGENTETKRMLLLK